MKKHDADGTISVGNDRVLSAVEVEAIWDANGGAEGEKGSKIVTRARCR